jgi:hypothetical protein
MTDSDFTHNPALIAATLGYTTVEIIKLWKDTAPSLADMRAAPENDVAMWQNMLDANYLGAGLSLLIGGTVSYLAKSWVPILLSLGTLSFMAFWYRMVLRSDHTMMEGSDDGTGYARVA